MGFRKLIKISVKIDMLDFEMICLMTKKNQKQKF